MKPKELEPMGIPDKMRERKKGVELGAAASTEPKEPEPMGTPDKMSERTKEVELGAAASTELEPMGIPDEKSEKQTETELGAAAYQRKEFEAAIEHYTKALELDGANFSILTMVKRATVYVEMGKYEEGIKDCGRAVERGREVGSGCELISMALTRKGTALVKMAKTSQDYAPAIEAFKEALTLHQNSDTSKKLEEAELAKKDLEQKENFNPKLDEELEKEEYLNHELAVEELEKGNAVMNTNTSEAISRYTEALRLNPNCARAYNGRAHCYMKLGHLPEALKDTDELIKCLPKHPKAYSRKGQIQYLMAKYDEALETYEQGLQTLARNYQELLNSFDMSQEVLDELNRDLLYGVKMCVSKIKRTADDLKESQGGRLIQLHDFLMDSDRSTKCLHNRKGKDDRKVIKPPYMLHFSPKIASIGPYFRALPGLDGTEAVKQLTKEAFYKMYPVARESCPEVISNLESRVREAYIELDDSWTSTKLNNQMLLDGIFLIICYLHPEVVHGFRINTADLVSDIFLVGNQIPHFVIESLLTAAKLDGQAVANSIWPGCKLSGMHLLEMCVDQMLVGRDIPDVFRYADKFSATELYNRGLKFMPVKGFCNLRFDSRKGVLYIPKLVLNKETPRFFANVVAQILGLENQLYHQYVIYLCLMECLVKTPEDFSLLLSCGVFHFAADDIDDPSKLVIEATEGASIFRLHENHRGQSFDELRLEILECCARPEIRRRVTRRGWMKELY